MAETAAVGGYLAEIDQAGNVPPGLQDFLNKAEEAVKKRNYKYAIDMYRRILRDMPNNLWIRKNLRATELKRNQDGQGESPILGTIMGIPALVQLLALGLAGKHAAAMNAAEAFLARVPTNTWVLRRLAESAHEMNLKETAIFTLENAINAKPQHVGNLVRLSELYLEGGRPNKAVQCLRIACGQRPNDRVLAKRLNDMSAEETIDRGNLEQRDYRKSIKDVERATELDRTDRFEKTESDQDRLIKRYQAEVEAHPDDANAVRRLAGAYRDTENWDEAYTWYQRASELDPSDGHMKVMMGDARRAKYRAILRLAQDEVEQKPGDAAAAGRLKTLRKEFDEFELAEFKRRVDAYPTDLSLKYEYGIRLFRSGDVRGAIQQFQRSVREPKRSLVSRVYLGRCFLAEKHPELAKEQFTRALEQKEVLDDEEALGIYYYLALAQEDLGDFAGAIESYGKIYTVDVSFRDVTERMERARQKAKDKSAPPAAPSV